VGCPRPAPSPYASSGAPDERLETTQGYIRQTEAVGLASDPLFPTLPGCLASSESSPNRLATIRFLNDSKLLYKNSVPNGIRIPGRVAAC
jgi:hypothetical protein